MKKAVIGVVDSQDKAESLVSTLRTAGFTSDEVSVLFADKETNAANNASNENPDRAFDDVRVAEGAIAGGGAGTLVGGVVGLLAGVGALVIPGIGPLIAAGPLLGLLGGGAAGATLGGMTGALVGLGISEMEAEFYRGRLRSGGILVAVHPRDTTAKTRADQIMHTFGARDVSSTREDMEERRL